MRETSAASELAQSTRSPFDYYARLGRVRDLVLGNLRRDVSRDEAAGEARMEPTAFSRFFKEEVGIPYSDWKKLARVAKAVDLIESGNLPLRRVATLAGFQNPRTFRRAFRSITGFSPREYRDAHRSRLKQSCSREELLEGLSRHLHLCS